MKRGFTLIELLVVVLIIAILAAVALPQYTRTVAKTRMTECLLNTAAILAANERYKLMNDEYAIDLAQLDISMPNMAIATVPGYSAPWKHYKSGNYIYALEPNVNNGGAACIYYGGNAFQGGIEKMPSEGSHSLSGKTVCMAWTAAYENACLSLGGTLTALKTADSKGKIYELP
ncbi:prepilin-type N-terminal cleavage/methylation domain-containing protein [Parelusimicrobium proximum]|uniref:type IV pilin protein n=1 Tax=Parelusimicrobium proximum TaxID=3228953 RepID=UPI003D1816B0